MFRLYQIGTKFGFEDVDRLLALKDFVQPQDYLAIFDIVVKMTEEIYHHWFADMCIARRCLKVGHFECATCHGKLCSVNCRHAHATSCKSEKLHDGLELLFIDKHDHL